MYYSNIPTILAQQDFNNRHADILASARGEGIKFIGWDFGSKDETHYWFGDLGPIEENIFYRMWREGNSIKRERVDNVYEAKYYEETASISDSYDDQFAKYGAKIGNGLNYV
jgi:hypothetical protein